MNDMMNPRRRGDRSSQRSEGKDLEKPCFEGDGSSSDEQPDQLRRNQREDNRRWESGMRVSILEFHMDTLNPEGFIDWLVTVEEMFEFKEEDDGVANDDYEEASVFDDDQYEEEIVSGDVGVNLMVRHSCLTPQAVGDD
nr:reverse transcriptase domain-containing protein [Tanacetum cinerariifolium]